MTETIHQHNERRRRAINQRRASLAGARRSWKGALSGIDPALSRLASILDDHVGHMGDIAKRSGVSQHTLFNWLRRRRSPTVENLRAVLNTLGYDLRVHKINRDEDDE